MNPTFDVLISGFGPTGASLAGLLGQRGLRVAVFDRLADLYPLPRAIGLDHEAMRIAQELGITESIAPHIAAYQPSEYLGMDGKLIKRLDTLPAPHPLYWAPNYVFNQPAFEAAIRTRVAQLDNVSCFLNTEVVDSGQADGQAWISARNLQSGALTSCTGHYLIACDGGASPIRKRLGIALEDLGFDEPWLVVDAIVPDEKLAQLPQTQVQYCEAERPLTFVVGPGNHRRWEIMLDGHEKTNEAYPDEKLWPLLKRWIQPGDAKLLRRAAYRFHGLVATSWRQGHILLAGDAAHMTPPFMAQGMVQGMRDAANLAWKLERVIKGQSHDSLLDTYFEERAPHVKQTTLTAMELGRVICERDASKAQARDARLRKNHHGAIQTEYRQNMIPPLRHGLVLAGSPGAGSLFPQPELAGTATTRLLDDALKDTCASPACVVSLGTCEPQWLSALHALVAQADAKWLQLGGVADPGSSTGAATVQERHSLLQDWFAAHGACMAIVRPDHYVYATAASMAEGVNILQAYVQALQGCASS